QVLFRPSPDDMRVVLDLTPRGRWVAEYYPCEDVTELGDGRLRVTLRTPDAAWARRLALGLGEDGHVVSPPALAAAVRADAAAAPARYGGGGPAGPPPAPPRGAGGGRRGARGPQGMRPAARRRAP